jgi:hypothetical protein
MVDQLQDHLSVASDLHQVPYSCRGDGWADFSDSARWGGSLHGLQLVSCWSGSGMLPAQLQYPSCAISATRFNEVERYLG